MLSGGYILMKVAVTAAYGKKYPLHIAVIRNLGSC